jgi:Flp pilus assembly protein protease CpaA
VVTATLLSILWLALAAQDIRVQKLANVGTFSAFALALGHRLGGGEGSPYLFSLAACTALVVAIYATGMVGGGDAKLLLSVLAWQPTVDTWTIVLACLAAIGGGVIVYERVRLWLRLRREQCRVSLWGLLHRTSRRHPLGGVISVAGLVMLWTTVLVQ